MKIQIDDIVREATSEEVSVIESERTEFAALLTQAEEKKAARAAVLAKLGLTADEISVLLG